MARRDYRQLNLAEALLGGRKSKRERLDRLFEMHELIEWKPIDMLLAAINRWLIALSQVDLNVVC